MEPENPQGQEVWPPPPTLGPPTVAGPSAPEFSRSWVFGQIVGRMTLMGLGLGAVCGAGFGGVVAEGSGLGLMIGFLYGGAAGFLLGVINGFVLAALTCVKFFPLQSVEGYRCTIGTLAVMLMIGGASVLWACTFGGWWWMDSTTEDGGSVANWFEIVPVGLAAGAAWFASQRVAKWYAAASGRT